MYSLYPSSFHSLLASPTLWLRILALHLKKALRPNGFVKPSANKSNEGTYFNLKFPFSRCSLTQKCLILIHVVLPDDDGPFSINLIVELLSCSISTVSCLKPSSFSNSTVHSTSSKVVLNAINSAEVELLATDFCFVYFANTGALGKPTVITNPVLLFPSLNGPNEASADAYT